MYPLPLCYIRLLLYFFIRLTLFQHPDDDKQNRWTNVGDGVLIKQRIGFVLTTDSVVAFVIFIWFWFRFEISIL